MSAMKAERRSPGPICGELTGESPGVKTIIRRLRRLEDRFCPPVETEFSRRLRKRAEAARRRLAESDTGEGRPPYAGARECEDVSGLSVEQILLSGRQRALRGRKVPLSYSTAIRAGMCPALGSALKVR
jgi:hypothetical protein